jgi:hypothetical protein
MLLAQRVGRLLRTLWQANLLRPRSHLHQWLRLPVTEATTLANERGPSR